MANSVGVWDPTVYLSVKRDGVLLARVVLLGIDWMDGRAQCAASC